MPKSWYRLTNKAGEADLYIYDEIGYWGITAADLVRELQALDAETINVHLNSPGGEVFDGIAIYNALKNHPATINVKIDSLAASAASFIAQAGDKVAISKVATMMIHEAQGIAMGDSETMLKMAEELDMLSSTISEIYADRAGGEIDEWRSRMRAESWYRGQEAVDIGLADELMETSKTAYAPAIFNLSKYRNVPDYLKPRPRAAGRTMSQSNLDKLHGALSGLNDVHFGTCDMGDDCPMDLAAPVAVIAAPAFDLGKAFKEALTELSA